MHIKRKSDLLFLGLLILSLTLRLALVLVNRQANDDHMQVINRILASGTLPQKSDCWECFQPKLFHVTVALTIQGLGLAHSAEETKILLAQVINFFAGAISLGLIGLFIRDLPVKMDRIKPLAFALLALNPQWIRVSSQATNDAFAILFSTLALYLTTRFIQKPKAGVFGLIVLSASLGIASKTNTWVTAAAICLTLFAWAWVNKNSRCMALASAVLFVVLVPLLSVIDPLTQYIANTREYGAPILLNMTEPPLPHFSEVTYPHQPGILSIQDGFFTFKFFSLLRNPLNRYIGNNLPSHRTSLWTQLYASANSLRFENFPSSWATTGGQDFTTLRGIFILALLPTAIFLIGAASEAYRIFMNVIRRNETVAQSTAYGLFGITFLGYLVFITLYALIYRDYTVMKVIFIYPGLLALSVLFIRGGDQVYRHLIDRAKWVIRGIEIATSALLVLYLLDVVSMIHQLALLRLGS